MPFPDQYYGIINNPIIFTPFIESNQGGLPPVPGDLFLLSDGTGFLLSDGTNLLLST